MSGYPGMTVSEALLTSRRSLEAAVEARAKKRMREKRLYQTSEGLLDEDEFGDMLISALTANPENGSQSPPMPITVATPVETSATVPGPAHGMLVVGGYIVNYFR